MTTEIANFTKKFKVTMSNKTEFSVPETEMKTFSNIVKDKGVYKTPEGILINTAFFMTAEPFSELDGLSNYQRKKLAEKEASVRAGGTKVTNPMRLEWANKLLKGKILFN